VDGSAIAGVNYLAASGAILVPAGVTSVNLPVTILGSSTNGTDKNFSVNFTGSAGTGPAPAFAAAQTFATGNAPRWVTAADINGDGKPDLIVTNAADQTVSVLLNTTAPGAANATFAAPQSFPPEWIHIQWRSPTSTVTAGQTLSWPMNWMTRYPFI